MHHLSMAADNEKDNQLTGHNEQQLDFEFSHIEQNIIHELLEDDESKENPQSNGVDENRDESESSMSMADIEAEISAMLVELNKPVYSEPSDLGQKKSKRSAAYKTKLCFSYERNGWCSSGSNCCFAHGTCELRKSEEIRQPTGRLNPKYKTKLCNKYWSTGFCRYGESCQFIHKELEKLESFAVSEAPKPNPENEDEFAEGRAEHQILSIDSSGDGSMNRPVTKNFDRHSPGALASSSSEHSGHPFTSCLSQPQTKYAKAASVDDVTFSSAHCFLRPPVYHYQALKR